MTFCLFGYKISKDNSYKISIDFHFDITTLLKNKRQKEDIYSNLDNMSKSIPCWLKGIPMTPTNKVNMPNTNIGNNIVVSDSWVCKKSVLNTKMCNNNKGQPHLSYININWIRLLQQKRNGETSLIPSKFSFFCRHPLTFKNSHFGISKFIFLTLPLPLGFHPSHVPHMWEK